MRFVVIFILCLFSHFVCHAQGGNMAIEATLQTETDELQIKQQITYVNTSNSVLSDLHFLDWANSFAEKTTPLAQRFAENFENQFHFEKEERRGRTTIHTVISADNTPLPWERGKEIDILVIPLQEPLQPKDSIILSFDYTVKLPDDKFTRHGVTRDKEYYINYWNLAPAVYTDGLGWESYSNRDTDDFYSSPINIHIKINVPEQYFVFSSLDEKKSSSSLQIKTVSFTGKNRRLVPIQLVKDETLFDQVETDKVAVITSIKDNKLSPTTRALFLDKIIHFLDEKLGPYPFQTITTTIQSYKNNPVYGLNQLPDFISPFPSGFEYEMEQLKTITGIYLDESFQFNNRKDYWLKDALQVKLVQDYVDTYYPNMKLIGSLSDFFIVKWLHAADVSFNEQYNLLYLQMARNNLHQKLTTPKDSLVEFNKEIASGYYGGQGLTYLEEYLGEDVLNKTVKEFYEKYAQKPVKSSDFQELLAQHTSLPIDWFFEDYVDKRTLIDFKIKKVRTKEDSLEVTILSKNNNHLPVSLYGIDKDSIIFKQWIAPFTDETTVTIAKEGIRKLAVNYNEVIPEFNDRNNIKNLHGILNRPIQLRLFQDIQDNNYNQAFFMPIYGFNLYDGLTTGIKLYNKTVLPKQFHYKIQPQYGFTSKKIIGSAGFSYNHLFNENSPYNIRFGVSGNYFSYNTDLFYRRLTPFMTFSFRRDDLRANERQFINLRSITVQRDEDPSIVTNQNPNYSVFNARYVYSNINLINFYTGNVDYQISSQFAKLSTTFNYRKLFLSNRQINIRAFAGVFLFNDTAGEDDFFSFALDRPTDYLFDYDYYGRSEASGLFSQQLIIAEGGFKSQLQPAFANRWMTTINADTNIWKWIFAYGDVGLVNNRETGTQAVFDSGIRVSLVQDFFELYFPMYSNLGWEPGLPNYDQRIRFIVTLSPRTLLSLFTRKWY